MIRWPQICALRDATTTLALPDACNLFQRVCFSQLVFDTQPGKLHLAIIGAPPHNLVKLLASHITYVVYARACVLWQPEFWKTLELRWQQSLEIEHFAQKIIQQSL